MKFENTVTLCFNIRMSFLPDLNDEYLSELITRPVPLPEDGRFRNFIMQRRYWLSYDVINRHRSMWPEDLIKRARFWAYQAESNIDVMFPRAVWSMHYWFENSMGIDTGLRVPPRPG